MDILGNPLNKGDTIYAAQNQGGSPILRKLEVIDVCPDGGVMIQIGGRNFKRLVKKWPGQVIKA